MQTAQQNNPLAGQVVAPAAIAAANTGAVSRRTPSDVATPITAGFFDLQGFELMQRVANAFSRSSLVPQQYQGNLPNCMIAMDMAQRIGANPLMVMQNLYIVHGTPGWSSKFLVATINVSGRYSSLRYEWQGEPGADDYGCRAWAVEKATGERLDGTWITWAMVRAEGWANKNGSKWKTMPDQMFVYRAAAFWQRAYAPELGMGLTTAEELHDVLDATPDADGVLHVVDTAPTPESEPEPTTKTEAVKAKLAARAKRQAEPAPAPTAAPEPDARPTDNVPYWISGDKEPPVESHMSYATVADLLTKAETTDALDDARDLIRSVVSEEQQAELNALAAQRLAAIKEAA